MVAKLKPSTMKKLNKAFITAAVISGVVIAYNYFRKEDEQEKSLAYTNSNITLTLSHSILSSSLPLEEILLHSHNVTFIIPPNVETDLSLNYKVLKTSTINGYFALLKNLKPDLLILCQDDLGIDSSSMPKDLPRFVKQTMCVEQGSDVENIIGPLFRK